MIFKIEYTSFDILGRVTGHRQTTDGENYETEYVYNLSGALIEQTYPSGRVVKNVLDNEGDLAQVLSKKNASDIFRQYANNFVYTAAGAVASMKLGNGKFENTTFNSRLQPTQIGLGSSATDQGLLKLNYDYGATSNNGNVLSQTITVPTIGQATGFVATQAYSYDSLNRLKQATENITPNGGSQTPSWQQTYTFDRYGNRNFDEANTTTLPKDCTESGNPVVCEAIRPIVNPSVNTANNQLNGYTFDPTGNTTVDAEGRQFNYDAENKQVIVKDSQNQLIGEFSYDGDAKRIKKFVPATGETTIFVYDVEGRMVAEYSTQVEQSPKISYLTHDQLGSPRILTDQLGAVVSRRDFMPYGEEITRSGYGQDTVRERFATYERDTETYLDFAQARMYSSELGRFLVPDEPFLDQWRSSPQSWNLYSYVRNNPLKLTDPSGNIVEGDDPGLWEKFRNWWTYGYAVSDEEIKKMADERRATLKAMKVGFENENGEIRLYDVDSMNDSQVFSLARHVADLEESGQLRRFSESQLAEAAQNAPLVTPVGITQKPPPTNRQNVAANTNSSSKPGATSETASELGFSRRIAPQRAPFNSHGQAVFSDGRRYITRDVDSHSGGVWKMFDRRGRRLGTYDANLKRIGD